MLQPRSAFWVDMVANSLICHLLKPHILPLRPQTRSPLAHHPEHHRDCHDKLLRVSVKSNMLGHSLETLMGLHIQHHIYVVEMHIM